jgi:DNA-binding transcriptional LysR family regulator
MPECLNPPKGAAGSFASVLTSTQKQWDRVQRYPEMKLDIVTDGRLIDIVVEGFDAGIRLMESVPRDMIAVPFGDRQRFAVVRSPAYFAQHEPPRGPVDLSGQRCIRRRMPSGSIYQWEFERHGETVRIDGEGTLTLDEPGLMLAAARAGLGLAYLIEWHVNADLKAGTLVRVLEDWTPPLDGLCLYYPGRRHVPAGLRALTDMIREYADANRKRVAANSKRRPPPAHGTRR